MARRFRESLDLPLMLLGGITSLDTMEQATELGFEFVAMGRALIREPDLIRRMLAGETKQSLCIPCNRCVAEMERDSTRCVYRD
jgi:2,4-dienoyl-CoA reductase-like NADH-dependent reductase (Old Yellow Enzyme family)